MIKASGRWEDQLKRAAPLTREGRDPPSEAALEQQVEPKLSVQGLNAYYGKTRAIKDIALDVPASRVTAIIGPSGCGKSTLLRCLNRMHEEVPGGRVEGRVLLDGEDIYARGVDPVAVRRRTGMVFQKANPFPTMSVLENVVAGLKLARFWMSRSELNDRAEHALRKAVLWEEVKDRLGNAATGLSGGQQQRLCIARALAVEPEVLLLDEPCSALDPVATLKIEDLMRDLAQEITIVIVTHNMQQAARVSDRTAFMLLGEMIEYGESRQVFTNPADERTEAYITGRFG